MYAYQANCQGYICICDIVENEKKGTITGLCILLLSGWFASCSRDINYMLFMSLAVVNIKDYADKNVEM